jgi:hypothetical protein
VIGIEGEKTEGCEEKKKKRKTRRKNRMRK